MALSSLPSIFGSRRPYKLVTVSRCPEKSTLMVKHLAEAMRDRYMVIHAANCERVEEVAFRVRDLQPDLLVWTSSWTAIEVDTIRKLARAMSSDVYMCGLPEEVPGQKSVDVILKRLGVRMPASADDTSSPGSGSTSSTTPPISVR